MKIVSNRTGAEVEVADWFGQRKVDSGRYEAAGSGSDAPSRSDTKAAWVDYAVAQGADRDEAEASTKGDLIDLYG